ncbi:MAG TPA: acyltransferase family protein, partial [Spirochaetia bacterium]
MENAEKTNDVSKPSVRLFYVDWLRILAVLSLVPFHAACTYLPTADAYIKTSVDGWASLPFLIVIAPLDGFFMTLLFFVSGIGAYYSFSKRTTGSFIGERARRLLLPLLFGTLLVCIPSAYMRALQEGYSGGLGLFYGKEFWIHADHYLGYGHLWFLFYLFVFSTVLAPLFG